METNHLFTLLKLYPDKNWNKWDVAWNINLTWDIILSVPGIDWYNTSANPNITWDVIISNPDKPWNWN